MTAYYNEIDPYAAQWLRNLIQAGHIAPGDVDERDMREVKPDELKKYTQCHFFAGIGVWSFALRKAGWSDDKPVWTGSCPCQPFSAAGNGKGFVDERHLWPHWFHLITQCQPGTVFGEQVASKDGLSWLDLVQADLEGAEYTNGAIDLCAAGIGAPHIRQRLWFVAERLADTSGGRQQGSQRKRQTREKRPSSRYDPQCSNINRLADTSSDRCQRTRESTATEKRRESQPDVNGELSSGFERHTLPNEQHAAGMEATNGFWGNAEWLFCRDEKWRPVEPGTFPLANGITNRVGRLRAYGNAINAEAAAEFIKAYNQWQVVNNFLN